MPPWNSAPKSLDVRFARQHRMHRPPHAAMQTDDAAVSLECWRSTHDAFTLGRLTDAASHTARGLQHSRAGSVLAVAHATNAHALGARPSPPYAGGHPTPDASAVGLFAREAALTGAYNVALSHARGDDLSSGVRALEAIDAVLALPPSAAAIDARGTDALSQGCPPESVKRLARAAAAALQLRAALALVCGDTEGAAASNRVAKLWLRADASLAGADADKDDAGTDAGATARGAILDSLALASAGDLPAAAAAVEPHAIHSLPSPPATDALEGSTALPAGAGPESRLQLAATYQCGALHALHSLHSGNVGRTGAGRDQSGDMLLLRSALAGYRSPDANALLGRIRPRPRDALRAFQASLAADHLRPGTLADAAVAFEEAGRHRGQAEIASCLAALDRPPARTGNRGVVEVAAAWVPDRDEVSVAHARALLLAGRPARALGVIDAVSGGRGREATRAAAFTSAAVGEVADARARSARFAEAFPRVCSAQISVADAALASDDVPAAAAALQRAVSVALREDAAEDRATACARAAVRGVCFNNRAVLSLCASNDNGTADGMFAAAQVALDKAAASPGAPDDVRAWARAASDAATWNRVLLFAESGRADDAASHWIARRKGRESGGGRAEFAKAVSHVMGIVDEGSLRKMDRWAEGVEGGERGRGRLNEVVREAAERW